jgi:galactose mutarotase-like enzyme
MKKTHWIFRALCALGMWELFLSTGISAAVSGDSVVFSQGNYTVTKRLDGAKEWVYTLSDKTAGSSAAVYQRGATLKSFIAALHGIGYSLIDNNNGMFKMMPWPNRTAGGKFTDSRNVVQNLFTPDNTGAIMTENTNGNAIHGMVKARLWSVEETGADSDGVFVRCYFDTDGFPVISAIFGAFRDYSVFRLKGNGLIIDAYVKNKGARIFDNCGWGYHPYFNAPAQPLTGSQKGSKARCSFFMPANQVALVDGGKIPTGVIQSVTTYNNGYYNFHSLRSINNVDLDTYYTGLVADQGKAYTRSVLIDFGNRVRLQTVGAYPLYPWMVIYNPNGSTYFCIEYQTEEVNGLNTKQNLIAIPAGGTGPTARLQFIADDDTTLAPLSGSIPNRRGAALAAPDRLDIRGMTVVWQGSGSGALPECAIYDLRGSRLTMLTLNARDRHIATGTWDGKNSAGQLASAGIYFVKINTGGKMLVKPLLVHDNL